MRFRLSKLVPVRMTSHYEFKRAYWPNQRIGFPEVATWWQWRGRIWAHRRDADFEYQRERNNW